MFDKSDFRQNNYEKIANSLRAQTNGRNKRRHTFWSLQKKCNLSVSNIIRIS